ncbi:MAG: Alpha/beta fold hydrolase [Actinomycetota bacterium]|nr:Alpha/beta fold hydrolase [Actinomycetota bacterium]
MSAGAVLGALLSVGVTAPVVSAAVVPALAPPAPSEVNAAPVSGTAPPVPAAPVPAAPAPATAARGEITGLRWRPCPASGTPTLQCGRLLVPYDYSQPAGPQFALAVSRVPATGRRTGSLFFNPGGPGGAGAGAVAGLSKVMPAAVRARFDLVSWDPRGIGNTRPALKSCLQPRLVLPVSGVVDWPTARAESAVVVAAANRTCQASNSSFINHMGTNNAARDLDRLRAAVGDRKLTYWGLSYGTRIGYVYALMYPNRIRAMTLDGNIDPKSNYAGLTQGGVALDSALRFMSSASPPTYAAIMAMVSGLDAAPIPLGNGKQYTRWNYLTTMASAIPSESSWPYVIGYNRSIETARLNTPAGAKERAKLLASLDASDGNLGGAFSVVNCLDYADRMSAAAQNSAIGHNALVAPVYGGFITAEYALGCTGLSLRPDPVPTTRSAANRARIAHLPVVIANATNDGSTPMIWALQMKASFGRGVLLKYSGAQHGLWMLTPSTCINNRITNYFVSLAFPTPTLCPFAPPANLPRS